MASRLLMIKDINTRISCWSVKVLVYDKSQPRTSSNSTRTFQRLTLIDSEGQKVEATIFDNDIGLLRYTLELQHTYVVSNAKVSPVAEKYNRFGYPYQWIITRRTGVEPENSAPIPANTLGTRYTSLSDVPALIGDNTLVDVIGIVIDKNHERSFASSGKVYTVREYALMNEQSSVVVLSLWNTVAETEGELINSSSDSLPIIRATNLLVSAHHDGSLGSTPSTVILVNPPIPEVHALRRWCDSHRDAVITAATEKDYFKQTQSQVPIPTDNISTLDNILRNLEPREKFIIKARVQITDPRQKTHYLTCGECNSATDVDHNQPYTCNSCNKLTTATAREKVTVTVTDDTGTVDAVAFGNIAMDFTQMDPLACIEHYRDGRELPIGYMNSMLEGKEYLLSMRQRERRTRDRVQRQYTILNKLELGPEAPTDAATPSP